MTVKTRRRAVSLAFLVLFVLSLGAGFSLTSSPTEAGDLPNGAYLVLREGRQLADVAPQRPGERIMIEDHRYWDDGVPPPLRYLVLPDSPDVPLELARPPELIRELGNRGLNLELAPEHAETLECFTAAHVGDSVALVIDGAVVTTHTIRTTIYGGRLQITRCSDNGCEVLKAKLRE